MRVFAAPIGAIAAICLIAAPACAAPETWVAGDGTNAGNCPVTAPCKTFQYAHNKTADGGTINVLSAGNFGAVTIAKSISIIADGAEATIRASAPCNAAVCINAGADAVINLRGLTIDLQAAKLQGGGGNGVRLASGGLLRIEKTLIRGASAGISFLANSDSKLYITDTTIADSGPGSGVVVSPLAGHTQATLNHVRIENSIQNGLFFSGSSGASITAMVRDTVVSGSGATGIHVTAENGSPVTVTIERAASVSNQAGIDANGYATVFLGESTISGNQAGLVASGGSLFSYRTNRVHGNVTDGSPSGNVAHR